MDDTVRDVAAIAPLSRAAIADTDTLEIEGRVYTAGDNGEITVQPNENGIDDGPAAHDGAAADEGPAADDGIADDDGADFSAPAASEGRPRDLQRRRALEALLFATDAPLSAGRLADLLEESSITQVRLDIAALNDEYVATGRVFRIVSIARGYQLLTLPEFEPVLRRLQKQRDDTRLGDAALETLAVIAYKQPMIRADVEAIRGVACGEVLKRLRDLGLVRVTGRAEIIGRPLLYGTTRKFLDLFGVSDLNDLPPIEALRLRAAQSPPADAPVAPSVESEAAVAERAPLTLPSPAPFAAAGA